ncbi:hypothetical protein RvY_17840-2 [Ramazzottius varieornatus]|uniref:U-box domain-containing protein n=1 Tax=Ramazzottius varieornatus TaxID=947166 RepID=A0A1D1WA74_RAMVA|nr:hypothetical protein RvY_17840-1 [Ramazzottius varieornatus]GAV08099.1 hypothetical protein RvY_17840-2 [Ramazzottius varieornatus]
MVFEMLDLSSLFETTTSSDSPAQAGHEPQMARKDADRSQAGFLAAYFIKPPVNLRISFSSPSVVQIQKISFCPRIGKQCSTAATLSVRTHSQPDKLIQVWRGSWDRRITEVVLDGSANFRPNRIFFPSVPSTDEAEVIEKQESTNFMLSRNTALGEVTEIILTINRTDVSSAVALRNLRVYGQPSPKIGKGAIQSFLQRIPKPVAENEKKRVAEEEGSQDHKRLRFREPASSEVAGETHTREIPEGFLDELTYEVMSDPVILPSGHTVDMSSIRTHELVQRELGRRLFDPFTGVHCHYADIRSDSQLKQSIIAFFEDRRKS